MLSINSGGSSGSQSDGTYIASGASFKSYSLRSSKLSCKKSEHENDEEDQEEKDLETNDTSNKFEELKIGVPNVSSNYGE